MIFDGKAFANEIEEKLRVTVTNLSTKPKIVSVLVGDDPASELYTKLKKAAAERVGIEFEVVRIESDNFQAESLASEIMRIASQRDVTGVMIQLPLPGKFRGSTARIIESIPLEKDVDGLRWRESGILPATVKAVLAILDKIEPPAGKYVVLGARGAVGTPLVHYLRKRGIEVAEVEWDTPLPFGRLPKGEVVISCVGKAGLVTSEMISDNLIVIDVGMSEVDGRVVGDMTQEVYQMSSIAVGVPGGVGPVTIASLLSNAIDLYDTLSDLHYAQIMQL